MTENRTRLRSHADSFAIVGAACRLPGAPDLDAFWRLLAEGRDAVTSVPASRFAADRFLHPRRGEPGRSYSFAAGMIPGPAAEGDGADPAALFDAAAFGLSPREAAEMDPQQRLLLEVAAEALEDAGWPAGRVAGAPVGVFVGASSTDHADLRLADIAAGDRYQMTGTALSILANRLTNVFDLRGPAQTVDTACSSALVALHLACQALRDAPDMPAAVVGGVNMLLSPYAFVGFAKASMLSPSGRCHAFDARADGYVRAEGAGVVILRRLADAVADGDAIRGVVLGTGVNAAGRTVGLSLPNREAQAALLRAVLAEAGVDPARFAYFEAHGTGTAAGDPVETGALGDAIGRWRRPRGAPPLPIGSVKTNIGHLEPASGMAGLLKAMLVLERGAIPPSLHFETPNPAIDFNGLGLRVATALEPLPGGPGRAEAVAGVNSFGFGGTNATAILGPAPWRVAQRAAAAEAPDQTPPLLLSARSEGALRALAARWEGVLAGADATRAAALARGAARYRDLHAHRLAVRGADGGALAATLAAWRAGEGPVGAEAGVAARGGNPVAFVFSGNGAQWAGMACEALAASAAFRAGVAAADAALGPALGWSALARLEAGTTTEDLAATDIAQPLLFAIQVGIVEALRGQGIAPALCLGHSVGEVAAAWAAGVLDLGDAARLIAARSRHQHATRGRGRMAALGATAEEAEAALADLGLEIAAVNGPAALTVAGPEASLERLAGMAASRRWSFVPLDLDYAFHSAAMEPVRPGLLADLAGLTPRAGRVPFISTVTGAALAPGETCDALYWWRNLREPVRFMEAVRSAAAGARLFLEIGPNAVLQGYLRESLRDGADGAGTEAAVALPTLSRREAIGPGDPFPAIADRAYARGADPRRGPAFAGPAERRGLPKTPFDRKPAAVPASVESLRLTDDTRDHRLLGWRAGAEPLAWTRHLDTVEEPWLADHRLAGEAVLPAAAMAEMALAAAAARHPEAAALEVTEFQILRTLPLEAERARELRTDLDAEGGFTLRSRRRLSEEPWTLHARGRVAALPRLPGAAPDPAGRFAPNRRVTGAEVAGFAARCGLDYGPAFRPVEAVEVEDAAACARVALRRPEAAPEDAGWLLHPVRFDGVLQGLIGLLAGSLARPEEGAALVPVRFGRLAARRGAAPVASAEIRLGRRGARFVAADLVLRDAAGGVVAQVAECTLQRIRLSPRGGAAADHVFRLELVPTLGADDAVAPPPALEPALDAAREADAALDLTETALLLEGFAVSAAQAALERIATGRGDDDLRGVEAPEQSSEGDGAEAAAIAPGGLYRRAMLAALAAEGLAEADATGGGGWRLNHDQPPLPPAVEIWRAVLAEQPALAHELAWLARAAERLPAALADAPLPEAPPVAPPPDSAGFERLASVLGAAIGRIAAAWPATRPLRVLEIGAGGPLTRRALALLGRRAGLRVVYAGIAAGGAVADAAARARAVPPHAETIEFAWETWDPLGHAPPPLEADLILGLAPAAQARAGAELIAGLGRAAAPGAALLLVEPVAGGRIWEFACGQDPAWWEGMGPGGSTLLGADAWRRALVEAGWQGVESARLGAAPWPAVLLAARTAAPAAAEVTMAAPAAGCPPVVLFADAGAAPLRAALAALLAERGGAPRVTEADLDDPAAATPRALRGALAVVLADGQGDLPATLADVVRVAEAAEGAAAGFRLVTVGGRQPERGGEHRAAGAALFALGRVLANEMPELQPRRLDLCPRLAPEAAARRLLPDLLGTIAGGEAEIVLTEAARLVPRLRPGLPGAAEGPAGPAVLAVRQPGQLGSLAWEPQPAPPRPPGPGEIVVRVEAAGLNFRDLMWAQGLLPEDVLLDGFAGPTLGIECAGVVEAAGPGAGFRPGDPVFGFAPAALASRVVTRAEAVTLRPETLEPAAAATVPVAFLTAVYALETLARLRAGERVLIHGGAGGVGLAALQVALAAGARVAATAGTPAKRAFLRAAGAELVLDSRDAGFADALRAEWPEGVDVVLNSLAGEGMERSLGLLRPFGRFIELGKRDFVENTRVALRPLRRNVSWFAVDADALPRERPELAASLLGDIRARLAEGALLPLPHVVRGAAEVEAAFRTLQASAHIGKIVVAPPAAPVAEAAARPAPGAPWRPDGPGTYLVIGGVQGFGLETAKWLAAQGVTHLALISRRGAATPGAEAALRTLAALGARATLHACDATEGAALARVLERVRAAHPPIRGVVHAAAAFDDGAATALDAARFRRVVEAKLKVAENLDRLTAGDPLEAFLLFSSATTAFGNPGQANYVAANAALEALARRRRAQGRPAVAIGWGPIADAGVLAAAGGGGETAEMLRRRLGVDPMPAAEALDGLHALLRAGGPAVAFLARVGWGQARMALPVLAEPVFAAVRGGGGANGGEAPAEAGDLRERLRALPPAEARALLRGLAVEEAARILRLPPEAVPAEAPVAGFGLDSLGGLELRMALERRIGAQVPLAAVTEDLTLAMLAERIAGVVLEDREEMAVATLVETYEPSADAAATAAPAPAAAAE